MYVCLLLLLWADFADLNGDGYMDMIVIELQGYAYKEEWWYWDSSWEQVAYYDYGWYYIYGYELKVYYGKGE